MNKENQVITLGEALEKADTYDSAFWLFLEPETVWQKRTRAQVVRTDRYTLEPIEPVAEGLRRALSVPDIQDVVVNAKAQLKRPTTDQLVEALRYFVMNDAFIAFPDK